MSGFDQQWLDNYNKKQHDKSKDISQKKSVKVRGTRGRSNEPNKTELLYAKYLDTQKLAAEIKSYMFESVKLRLADKTWFTCDFIVITKNDELEFHEVKAGWKTKGGKAGVQEDAWVKLKVVADLYPFKFVMATYYEGQFTHIEI